MQGLAIKRELNEETRKEGVLCCGQVYSLHLTEHGEAIITDNRDFNKIYAVYSIEFFNMLTAPKE